MTQPEMLGHVCILPEWKEFVFHRRCGSSQEGTKVVNPDTQCSVLHAIKPWVPKKKKKNVVI